MDKLLTFTLLCTLISLGAAQTELSKFIVRVAHYRLPDLSTADNRCFGTVVSQFHVLTAASCVTPIGATHGIAVRIEFPVKCECVSFDKRDRFGRRVDELFLPSSNQ
jgi:hypothetical protein